MTVELQKELTQTLRRLKSYEGEEVLEAMFKIWSKDDMSKFIINQVDKLHDNHLRELQSVVQDCIVDNRIREILNDNL